MSFLDKNNSEFVSARLTQEGRRAIANGDFKIDYFSVGDSEFDYTGNLKYGIMNTFGRIWNINDGIQRDGPAIISYLFNFLQQEYKKLKFKHVYMFTPGSPYIYDMFTEFIKRKRALNIVDARSSIHISTTLMSIKCNLIFCLSRTCNRSQLSKSFIRFIERGSLFISSGLFRRLCFLCRINLSLSWFWNCECGCRGCERERYRQCTGTKCFISNH